MDTLFRKEQLLAELTKLREDNIIMRQKLEERGELDTEQSRIEDAINDTFDLVEGMVNGIVPDPNEIQITWSADDVRSMNMDDDGNDELSDAFNGEPLSDDVIQRTLRLLKTRHDCNDGITWDTIESTLIEVKKM